MRLVKKLVKAINQEKRNERVKNLTLVAALGAASGAATALLVAPKSNDINRSLSKLREKALETVEKGKGKVDELVKEGKEKLDSVRLDIMDSKDKLRDIKEVIKG